ncbi:MAG: hypothetical protein IKB10_03745 [Alphaproteobacteria bacterium]|nr:hypothetical protein [Alphaproteobacteria bacterium]
MELKTVIEIDGNFVDKKYRHITVNNKKELQQYLTLQLKHAFELMWVNPIIVLQTKLVGTIDGHNIATEPINPKLSIFVADEYKPHDDKTNMVFNPLRGNNTTVSKHYVIMNRDGVQLYPPLSANPHSEVEKFANRVFNTVYKVEKVR